jgi:hypothetical protein
MKIIHLSSLILLTSALLSSCNKTLPDQLTGKLPVMKQPIQITVKGQPTVSTDSQGSYTIPNIKTFNGVKFDIPDGVKQDRMVSYIVEDAESSDLTALFKPIAESFVYPLLVVDKNALIKGNLIKKQADLNTFLYLSDVQGSAESSQTISANSAQSSFEYKINASEFGRVQGSGIMYAFQSADSFPFDAGKFVAYGKKVIDQIPDSGVLEGQDIIFEPITSKNIAIKITLPLGIDPSVKNTWATGVRVDPRFGGAIIGRGFDTSTEIKTSMPIIAGAGYSVEVTAFDLVNNNLLISRKNFPSMPDSANLNIPSPIKLSEPKNEALINPLLPPVFRWTGTSGVFAIGILKKVPSNLDQTGYIKIALAITSKNEFDFKNWGIKFDPNSIYSVSITRVDVGSKLENPFLALSLLGHGKTSWEFPNIEFSAVLGTIKTSS